jgi:hypothetical protein
MKIEKIVLDTMERCYAASVLETGKQVYAVFASESIDGPCYAYTGERFSKKEVVWEKAGGTMSLVRIPGAQAACGNGDFIAVQHFFPGFQSAGAKLVWGRRSAQGDWEIQDLASLPYVHRFDLFPVEDEVYILAATLCGSKKNREDWSDPGKVYAGKLPKTPREGVTFAPVLEHLTKNHGYCRGLWEGRDAGFITSEEGAFAIKPPLKKENEWEASHILKRPIGDIALCDLDGDGIEELITIEPFHGNQFVVNRKQGKDWEVVYRYPGELDFAHAVTSCTLRGKPAVLGGVRRKNSELFILQYTKEKGYEAMVVEEGIGPSNVAVINGKEKDYIISANHTKNEAAVYVIGG